MGWTVIVPMNSLDRAKSRLVAASDSPAAHRSLVAAMRADTVAAVAATSARLVVVTSQPGHLEARAAAVLADPGTGLNAAISHADRYARQRWPQDGVAVVVGDLPALTGSVLSAVLAGAADHPRGVVLDRQGTGTTMLLAGPGQELRPAFGVGSAGRHIASGAHALAADDRARCDVDVPRDLDVARDLGLGPHTRAVRSGGPFVNRHGA